VLPARGSLVLLPPPPTPSPPPPPLPPPPHTVFRPPPCLQACSPGRFNALTGVGQQRPVVPRVANVTASSFRLWAQAADADGAAGPAVTPFPGVTMSCLAVEAGKLSALRL
jgi:hypothetical protein